MRYLQEAVFGGEGIHLGVDPAGLWQRFQTACKEPDLAGTRLRVWNLPGDSNTPMRVLRYFLPKEEGGVDSSGRREQASMQLVPWPYYPRELKLPGPPGEGLAKVFEKPFIAFSLEARLPKDLLPVWLPGL